MTRNPTYKELERRVKDLEKESLELNQAKQVLESERDKLKILLDGLASANIGVDIVTANYEVLLQNQTLIDRFGDIVGKKCYKEYMALDEPCAFCPMVKALENNRLERTELRGADGRCYELLAAPLTNPDGTVDKAIEVVQDITDRKQAEKALRESEKRYRTLISEMLNSFALHEIMVDNNDKPYDFRFLEVNLAFEEMTGLQGANIVGKTVLEVLPKTEPYWIDTYGEVALTGKSIRFENYSKEFDKYFEVLAYSPKKGQFATVFTDITDRKRVEEEREKLIQEALKEIKTLRGILPLCSYCKKIRDDKGYWEKVDVYIYKYLEADISHSICPDCMKKRYPEEYEDMYPTEG